MAHLVLLGGPAGSGKSSAAALLDHLVLHGQYIVDPLRKELSFVHGLDWRETSHPLYVERVQPILVQTLLQTALSIKSELIVLEWDFSHLFDMKWQAQASQLCAQEKRTLHTLWMTCDTELARERMAERGNEEDLWRLLHPQPVSAPKTDAMLASKQEYTIQDNAHFLNLLINNIT
jgi:energy-coupling factor transporter ATP-binding protein EcfA2